jgi:hypothetical protein
LLFHVGQLVPLHPGGLEELEAVIEAADRKAAREEEAAAALALAMESGDEGDLSPSASFFSEGVHIPSQTSAPQCTLPEK